MTLPIDMDILALIGVTILVTFAAGRLFSRLKIPQVVGFVVAGVVLGPSFLHLIPDELNANLTFVSEIALGLIGFDMGAHLRFDTLRKLGRSILFIVLCEATGAFLLVTLGTYALTGRVHVALILGAIAAATAPAATVDVLAEYRAKGPLTTTLLAVVGLDDMLALLLFSVAAALAESIVAGGQRVSLVEILELPLLEIGGSLLVGLLLGLVLSHLWRLIPRRNDAMLVAIGMVFLCTGLARALHLSLILTPMVMGVVIINRNPQNGHYVRHMIETVGPLIYVLFFALAGARLSLAALPSMGLVGLAYIGLRCAGKYSGAWLGGRLGGAEPAVRNNLGLALLSQAGVAIGLALDCCVRFGRLGPEGETLASLVLNVVTTTLLVVQIFGPIGVKIAISRAGEIGKAVGDEAWG